MLDRPKLESLSCECYAVVKKETDALLNYMPQRQVIKDASTIPTVTLPTAERRTVANTRAQGGRGEPESMRASAATRG